MRAIRNFINGASASASGGRAGRVFNPNTGAQQAEVAFSNARDLDIAVQAAMKALPEWSSTNPQRRARVLFAFKSLVEKNMDELAHLLSSEHGKVIADSKGDIQRGLEVIEFACGIPHALKGEYTEGAGPGIDVYSMRQPLGVVAGGMRLRAFADYLIGPFQRLQTQIEATFDFANCECIDRMR